ncbi:MAG: hypothetical protein KDC05_15540 [Bacteroidales bacterium]|nr:hypothetical protein [Bacteroidales bacterium]
MTDKNVIETMGKITKKEILGNIEPGLAGGYLLLENMHPYPGYHGRTVPDFHELIPDSIFAVTKTAYDDETLLRAAHEVRKKFKKKFDAATGQVTLYNEMQPCVRIKFLQSYKDVAELFDLFSEAGVQFVKYRKTDPRDGLIKINKFFQLEILEPGIYLDHIEPDMCYLQLPEHITWEDFEKITISMKRNMDDNKFDAAQAIIFRKNCVIDCVRIYDHHIKHDKIMAIRNKYVEAIKKL